mgnify:CR=1 FL=1
MKLLAVMMLFLSTQALAQNTPRILRCFSRAYSIDHLGRNPQQTLHSIKYALVTDNTGRPLYGYIRGFTPDQYHSWKLITGDGQCDRVRAPSNQANYWCNIYPNRGAYTLKTTADGALLTVQRNLYLRQEPTNDGEGAILRAGPDDGIYYIYSVPLRECADFDL